MSFSALMGNSPTELLNLFGSTLNPNRFTLRLSVVTWSRQAVQFFLFGRRPLSARFLLQCLLSRAHVETSGGLIPK